MDILCLFYGIEIPNSDWEKTPTSVKELVEKLGQFIKQSEKEFAYKESQNQELLEKINRTPSFHPTNLTVCGINTSIRVQPGYAQIGTRCKFTTTATINQPSYASDINFLGIRLTDVPKVTTLTAEDLFNQGLDKIKKGDLQGAIAAYTEAIRFNPKYALAYINRGVARTELGDNKGAMEDYNQALRINPNYAVAYYNRGITRSELGDKKGAITDLRQAADIFKKQGKIEDYQKALEIINRLQKYNTIGKGFKLYHFTLIMI